MRPLLLLLVVVRCNPVSLLLYLTASLRGDLVDDHAHQTLGQRTNHRYRTVAAPAVAAALEVAARLATSEDRETDVTQRGTAE